MAGGALGSHPPHPLHTAVRCVLGVSDAPQQHLLVSAGFLVAGKEVDGVPRRRVLRVVISRICLGEKTSGEKRSSKTLSSPYYLRQ
jgi:hypothetical protein